MLKTLLTVGLIGLLAALLLAGVNELTRDRIELEQKRRALQTLSQLLDRDSYDNELVRDRFKTRIDGLEDPATIYRARLDGEPSALLADVTTDKGYSGDIRLLVAIDPSGKVIGVRVLNHRETPGLGDRIERRRSDWIDQFRGASLGQPSPEQWKADQRDGAFDTLASATITSSAVIQAVRDTLEWYESNRDSAFQRPAENP
ncbi:MAG: RnfABCDGE type electron transport complex subunit G [Wenzhouxiangellaceae bacterium]|nr:RnfABCDGE type electron transport complex subunit G [Wenzhouxiangellaceae bacterium]